jgi:signal transduction histidine kinase
MSNMESAMTAANLKMTLKTTDDQPAHKLTPDIIARLRQVSTLSSLTDQQLECLEGLEEIHLAEGDVLIRQGETAEFFHILLSGRLSMFQTDSTGGDRFLLDITSGATFGEVPLLSNIPNLVSVQAATPSHLIRLNEERFWHLMTVCPEVRKAILGNMARRFQGLQGMTMQQEKMAALGTLAAGLMHELNNPGAAARRAAAQLRQNLERLHALSARFTRTELSREQKECLFELQEQAIAATLPRRMNSLEQSDAEEELATWMESAEIADAWKLAPTLVAIGITAQDLECARAEFPGTTFADALNWLEALASSQQLVGMIEESIGRVSDLVQAVKTYAYEGKGARQSIDVNDSIHATLIILGHKIREKQIVLEKHFAPDLPPLQTDASGLNQVWTNLLDNAIDAVAPGGRIQVKTWTQQRNGGIDIFISIADNGSGIPSTCQPHIFDTFYTTKEAGSGTGLGLGIVNRIVEQFHGIIRFSSVPGATEFIISIPTTHAPAKI